MRIRSALVLAAFGAALLHGCGGDGGNPASPRPDPGGDGAFDSGLHNAGFVFVRKFLTVGDMPYYCIPHAASGMTGMVVVSSNASTDTVDVTVGPSGAHAFAPATITVGVGGHVRWSWASSNHTVTSGTPAIAALRGPRGLTGDDMRHEGHD